MSKCPSTLRSVAVALWTAVVAVPLFAAPRPPAPAKETVSAASPVPDKGLELTIPKGAGKVEFIATGWPSALRIRGQGRGLEGTLHVDGDVASGSLSFPLDALDTGIDLRNRHMRENYLETAKYPSATLRLTRLDLSRLPEGQAFDVADVDFEGVLELHGLPRPVKGTARITRDRTRIDVDAALDLRTTDYGIPIPKYMGITVAEQVKVKVAFSALAQPLLAHADEGANAVRHR